MKLELEEKTTGKDEVEGWEGNIIKPKMVGIKEGDGEEEEMEEMRKLRRWEGRKEEGKEVGASTMKDFCHRRQNCPLTLSPTTTQFESHLLDTHHKEGADYIHLRGWQQTH
ncbi:hypothetical protein Pcinc_035217 [Petrolisthes cinctipes]|uniref:Uncharacterized protein n=1 Tax=Petrolisthes cinctipes TaxID=88211 RepID=A0AAE1BXA1_PETCI|nr:hypothetical protein Pcinc_035217 [Petrolisthes cinctipes]